jgi:putative ABC transport system permease protein
VTSTGLVIAAVVAGTTLLPLLHTGLGTWVPWMPLSYWVAGIAGAGALVLAGTVVPAALATRVRPIEAAG